ncbi:MAG TPA: ATP-binding protein [Bryobacteraceae bacterium]|nr:ATP-binding protein [Bryobacteraceae bacterium]
MPAELLDSGSVPFQAEGRLLQELGERLVASPEVALVELIKNSYDADSPSCEVRLGENSAALIVTDEGHGMTKEEFVGKWMRIATASKLQDRVSRRYQRRVTGAKGIGRFAVRYLGDDLTLITVAEDAGRGLKTKLTARFNWPDIDRLSDIRDAKVKYTLEALGADVPTGTTLEIRKLKMATDFASQSQLRADVLKIVSPLPALEAGKFKSSQSARGLHEDPGFRVILPGAQREKADDIDLADLVLQNYWARLQIELAGNRLSFNVWFSSQAKPKTLEVNAPNVIAAGFVADVRYFPKRKGVFQAKGIRGQDAWRWVRENCGVAVVDHGFRIVPYGYKFDDWLHLNLDKSHSERDWRSPISKARFGIPDAIRNRPADNPALYLPYNYQLVGAVFVESKAPAAADTPVDLTPSMDREGFLKNRAFDELSDFVRAGIEFLALQDKREIERLLAKQAREATETAREDVRDAIEFIKRSPTLTPADKSRIVTSYRKLADRIEEVEEYNEKARRSLTTMSLLGVVAGFMTHETKSLVFEMQRAVDIVASLVKRHPSLGSVADELKARLATFKGQLEYTQMFLAGVRKDEASRMSAAGQIRYVLKRFEGFASDHGINISWNASSDTETPALPPAVYTGVLLNLYTNAVKAVLSVTSSLRDPKVAIRAWNEHRKHFLEVSDNGVGIPPALRKRIWEPLYTTTSDTGNPLGSGMGLGLTLVKQVVEDAGGKIMLVDAPPGFRTCFRVVFPLE